MPTDKISFLVPFRSDGGGRERVWHWLHDYWKIEFDDGLEIVIGEDLFASETTPFSKTCAVNEAFDRSTGDIIVILDADAWIHPDIIRHCADRIRSAHRAGVPLWFVPYRHILRLSEERTEIILTERPCHLPDPDPCDVDDICGSAHGHRYGAMIQIMHREAFLEVGGMDPRFRGWGGEDVCFLHAVDTLYAPHKNVNTAVQHLWHPRYEIQSRGKRHKYETRAWTGQKRTQVNDDLSKRYNRARHDQKEMRALVDEGRNHKPFRFPDQQTLIEGTVLTLAALAVTIWGLLRLF